MPVNGRIAYRFHVRDLHLAVGPTAKGTPVRCRLLIDGKLDPGVQVLAFTFG
jgi:hypothetical protein